MGDMEVEMEKKEEDSDVEGKHHFTYMPTLVKAEEGEQEEQLYKLDPYFGFVPAEKKSEEEDMPETEARKKRDAQNLIYQPLTYYPVQPVHHVYQPISYVPAQTTVVRKVEGATEESDDKPQAETQPAQVQVPVLLPGVINPILSSPVILNPVQVTHTQVVASPLPENDFPVFPNDPETSEQGALEF